MQQASRESGMRQSPLHAGMNLGRTRLSPCRLSRLDMRQDIRSVGDIGQRDVRPQADGPKRLVKRRMANIEESIDDIPVGGDCDLTLVLADRDAKWSANCPLSPLSFDK
eukprot:12528330-Heterocapsa_arctica.AAC.1